MTAWRQDAEGLFDSATVIVDVMLKSPQGEAPANEQSGVEVFINGENLTNVQQTDWDPLLRPSRGVDGRWTVDAWAPLDGRVINGGVRFRF